MIRVFVCAMVVLLLASSAAWTAPVTLTFDEYLNIPVNGMTVKGVTFGFTGGDATYGTEAGPGPVAGFFNPPDLEGSTSGTLTMSFADPTTSLSFSGSLNNAEMIFISPAFYLALFGPTSQLIGNFTMDVARQPNDGLYPVGQFSYSGSLVSRVVVTFNSAVAPRFAIDNLTYDGVIPEPSTVLALLCGVAGMGGLLWRRRK